MATVTLDRERFARFQRCILGGLYAGSRHAVKPVKLEVQSYAGYKGDERPLRFWVGGHEHLIVEILRQWYAPDHIGFEVRTAGGEVHILRRAATTSEWSLDSWPPE